MRKTVIGVVIMIPLFILAGLFGYVLYNGPRMKIQQHVRAYQIVPPSPPAGTKTVEAPDQLPSPQRAASVTSPLPLSADNVAYGKVYYEYYCVFCHGVEGAGNGPVGESYIPVPADLRLQRIQQLPDGELLRAMLTGIGHEPVLEQTVPPRHRWQLVQYVRTLGPRQQQ